MLEFITVPLVVGISVLGIYKLFELFARRKERIMFIEKLSEKADLEKFNVVFPQLPKSNFDLGKFTSLKIGCLLSGLGLGLLVGFVIIFVNDLSDYDLKSLAIGSSVLLAGGIGLLIAFFIEQKIRKQEEKEK